MRKIVIVLLLVANLSAYADEGMWLLNLLSPSTVDAMQQKGLALTPEQLYSTTELSVKDAIVALDKGSCSGTMVSANGLLITNHHCAYSDIQQHSTPVMDYLKRGFWAESAEQELPNPGKTVSFLVEVREVTQLVTQQVAEQLSRGASEPNMMRIRNTIAREAVKGTALDAEVHSMFGGNSYYLYIYQTYRDVRLVGFPPESIGAFGGETDNWVWPRHTGDFAIYRVYTAPDGSPADYSPSNIPLKPKKFVPISDSGISQNDFVMILGYPGSTQRYLSSFGVKEVVEVADPIRVAFRDAKLNVIRKAMQDNDTIRIMYASKFSLASNYWKYSVGELKSVRENGVIQHKQDFERKFQEWANSKPTYKDILSNLEKAYTEKREVTTLLQTYNEGILFGAEIFKLANRMKRLEQALQKSDEKKANEILSDLGPGYQSLYKDFDADVDKQVFVAMAQLLVERLTQSQLPDTFVHMAKQYNWDMALLADNMYQQSMFANLGRVQQFLNNPSLNTLKSDPAFILASVFYPKVISLNKEEAKWERVIRENHKLFVKAQMEMEPQKAFYPDANSTMRLTYGTVSGYEPADGVEYKFSTTTNGVLEKNATQELEYALSNDLKTLFANTKQSKYALPNGALPTCFIANLDITGGNSGSSVLNGKGHLVGLAFDGNWEAMSGDIAFVHQKQRCICVDIRYVLFLVEKLSGNSYVLNDLVVVSPQKAIL